MLSFHHLFLLIIGGAAGTTARYLVYIFIDKQIGHAFPWGTLIVNLTGSFMIGLLWGLFEKINITPSMRLFIFIGILGSFTTFSTFAFDNFNLIHQGAVKMMLLSVLLNNVGGIGLCFIGFYLTRIVL
ncbi:MAG: fluoride efflux transporter CrcB [Bacteroidales bacterium]|nr:fluoride efflux transporter CrcB [Bacteroidales bacterium]